MNKTILDTNILIRFFTNDNKVMANKVESLFKSAKKNELVIPDVIVAEIVLVLESFYELPKNEIIEKIELLLLFNKFEINRRIIQETLDNYKEYSISYTDAYLLAFAKVQYSNTNIYSFDKGLQKVYKKVIEPS